MSRWDQQFFATTRGQIVALLRRTRRTVDDLAAALSLTDNAVRAHLLRLERDGLVQQRGLRRGDRRPSLVYELTPQAEDLFPKAHAPALGALLDVLAERCSADDVNEIAREAGRRLARAYVAAGSGDAGDRLQVAAHALSDLGGLAELEIDAEGRLELHGYACPLGGAVSQHPELCVLAEAFVSELSGVPIQQTCDRGGDDEAPHCHFRVVTP